MKWQRAMMFPLAASLAAGLITWSHAGSKARRLNTPADRQLATGEPAELILSGTIVPMITTPIASGNWEISVPLGTWVQQGQVIGTQEQPPAPEDLYRARQELSEAAEAQESAQGRRQAAVLSPAEGVIVSAIEEEGRVFGIASDPQRLRADVLVRQADLEAVRVGQESTIVLDGPAIVLHAKVSGISETPVDSPEGPFYRVILAADNPGGTWIAGTTMHARLASSLP